MNVTISDIAKMAGVAKSTVSRYLNNGSVSEKTKKKLDDIIATTGFQPNAFAQSLKAKRTNLIGVIAPRLDSYATSRVLMAIDETLLANDITAMMINTSNKVEREIDSLLNFARQKIDGIILIATEITEEHIEVIRSISVPVLLIGQEMEEFNSIIYNNYGAGFEIGSYIGQQGHEKVAYLGVGEFDIAVGKRRKMGVLDGLKKEGAKEVRLYETTFNIHDATIAAEGIFEDFEPTAIICATDNIALGALKTIMNQHKSIPDHVSLTGFGGYEVMGVITPAITTIKFEYEEMGRLAAETMMKMINDEDVDNLQKIEYQLILGESVKKIK